METKIVFLLPFLLFSYSILGNEKLNLDIRQIICRRIFCVGAGK